MTTHLYLYEYSIFIILGGVFVYFVYFIFRSLLRRFVTIKIWTKDHKFVQNFTRPKHLILHSYIETLKVSLATDIFDHTYTPRFYRTIQTADQRCLNVFLAFKNTPFCCIERENRTFIFVDLTGWMLHKFSTELKSGDLEDQGKEKILSAYIQCVV